ncbi:T-cell surface antigen CD2 [Amia ocellicauda]|uniref:T-cell surface antigen CD2 n=1 Tax=Amia ocellicauda TaxID=2972642 RepID=UPI003463F8AE
MALCSACLHSLLVLIMFLQTAHLTTNESVIVSSHTESVCLSLPGVPVTSRDVSWSFKDTRVAKLKNSTITLHGQYEKRAALFPNGTLMLKKPMRNDSGSYKLEVFKDGKCVITGSIWLELQDPVSEPNVQFSCSSDGIVELNCTVDRGDNVSFKWIIFNGSQSSSLGFIAGWKAILPVGQNVSGVFVCTVENNVSRVMGKPLKPSCNSNSNPCTDCNVESKEKVTKKG